MKSDKDLFENLWYDLKKLLWWPELNARVRCAFGNVYDHPGNNNFILGFAILNMGDLIGSGGGHDGGDDAEGGGGGGSIVGDSDGGGSGGSGGCGGGDD